MLQPYIPKISLGTVYRNLSQMLKNKMIKEINVNGISHYDGNIHDHQHFNCTQCKSIIDYTVDSNSLINQFKKITTHEAKECQVIFPKRILYQYSPRHQMIWDDSLLILQCITTFRILDQFLYFLFCRF